MYIYDNIYFKIFFIFLIIFCILLLIYFISQFTWGKIYESSQSFYYRKFNKYDYKTYLADKEKINKEKDQRLQELQQNHGIENNILDLDEEIIGFIKPEGEHAKRDMTKKYGQIMQMKQAIDANQGSIKNRWESTVDSQQSNKTEKVRQKGTKNRGSGGGRSI